MLVEEKTFKESDGSIGYYEAIFDSSNILQTTYFPKQNRLYISFNRGGVYSYENVDNEKYEEFKTAESQGKYFIEEIKKKSDKHPYRKEFSLYPEEIKDLKEERDNKKEESGDEIKFEATEPEDVPEKILTIKDNELNANNIVFHIQNEEYIKVTPEGFYWKGKMIENDEEIYDKFKEWLDYAFGLMSKELKLTNNFIDSEIERLQNKSELTEFEKGQLHELQIIKQWS